AGGADPTAGRRPQDGQRGPRRRLRHARHHGGHACRPPQPANGPDHAHRPDQGRVRPDEVDPEKAVDALQPPHDLSRPAGLPRPQARLRQLHAGQGLRQGRRLAREVAQTCFQEKFAMATETMQFKTELKQLLHLIVHSLYSHKEIFLRELISNASDAIDTIRFEGLTNPELLEGNEDWKIKLIPDKDKGTLTVSDNGVGMSPQTIVENLGTIARSGTRAFLEALKQTEAKDRPELIGQFGVGFYSSFMVADKVTVISRPAGNKSDGVKWESDGQGDFTIENVEKEKRGT